MKPFFPSSWARRVTVLISSVLLTLLLATTFLSSNAVHAAPSPPPPYPPGEIIATADVQGIAGVTQMVEFINPHAGTAVVNLQDAQGHVAEQDAVFFTPPTGTQPPPIGVAPTHPIVIEHDGNGGVDTTLNNGDQGFNMFNHGTYATEIGRAWAHIWHHGWIEARDGSTYVRYYVLQVLNGTYQRVRVPVHSRDPELLPMTLDFVNTTTELQTVMNQLYANTAFLALGTIATLTAQFTQHTIGKDYVVALLVVSALTNVVRDIVNKWFEAQRLSKKLIRIFDAIYAHLNGGRHMIPPPPHDDAPGAYFSNMRILRR